MKKILGMVATLILAFGISATAFANSDLAKPSLKTKSSITKMKTKKAEKPRKHRRHHQGKRALKKVTSMQKTEKQGH